MSDLLREIRSAQIRAGEGAVCDRLRELGLIAEKVADVQRPLNALEIADRLKEIYYGKIVNESADMLRQQHAEIERLNAERETIISDFLKRTGQYVTNDASRDAAIAAAVTAEREACAVVCEAISTGLSAYRDGYGASACLEAIRARTKP